MQSNLFLRGALLATHQVGGHAETSLGLRGERVRAFVPLVVDDGAAKFERAREAIGLRRARRLVANRSERLGHAGPVLERDRSARGMQHGEHRSPPGAAIGR